MPPHGTTLAKAHAGGRRASLWPCHWPWPSQCLPARSGLRGPAAACPGAAGTGGSVPGWNTPGPGQSARCASETGGPAVSPSHPANTTDRLGCEALAAYLGGSWGPTETPPGIMGHASAGWYPATAGQSDLASGGDQQPDPPGTSGNTVVFWRGAEGNWPLAGALAGSQQGEKLGVGKRQQNPIPASCKACRPGRRRGYLSCGGSSQPAKCCCGVCARKQETRKNGSGRREERSVMVLWGQ